MIHALESMEDMLAQLNTLLKDMEVKVQQEGVSNHGSEFLASLGASKSDFDQVCKSSKCKKSESFKHINPFGS